MKKHFIKWAAAAALLAALGLSGCGAPAVSVTRVKKEAAPFVYETGARMEALHSLAVVPQVSGPIISAVPDVGTAVTGGQLLFQIDPSPYTARRDEMAARIASGRPAAAPAIDDSLEASLLRQGIITRAEYNRLLAKRRPAAPAAAPEADEASTAALSAMTKAVEDCTVFAPISGVIAENYVSGTKTAAAGEPALVIRQNSPVVADIQIPAVMDPVLAGAKEKKTLTVTISGDGGTWYGELKPQPNENGDVYTAYRVQTDNPDNAIEIGKTYDVRIDSGQQAEGWLVPASAFVKDDVVEIVNENHLIDVRTVVVGGAAGNDKFVVAGLEDGDLVVTNPSEKLELGTEVRVR